jgi:hypothetical protein
MLDSIFQKKNKDWEINEILYQFHANHIYPKTKASIILAFPYGYVCHDPEWCVEKRNYRKLNIVIVRFDPSETNFNERSAKAINWLVKHNDTFQDFGE